MSRPTMSGTVAGPRSWDNGTWSIATNKAPILDTAGLEELEQRLKIPMPEMMFGNNYLEVAHASGWRIHFDAAQALDEVDKVGKTKLLQVAHSAEWKASKLKHHRESPPAPGQIDYDVNKVHRRFDWTYSTPFRGTIATPAGASVPRLPSPHGIPYEELKKQVPIQFFDDVQLYEDELGDFGLTTYSVKVRAMETNMLVLARMYMRVDDVAFRIRDTRVYVDFLTDTVVHGYTEKESEFGAVRRRVPIWAEDDYTQLLRDPNWISTVLDTQKDEVCEYHLADAPGERQR